MTSRKFVKISPARGFFGHPANLTIPGDKSISHRGIMLGALAQGKTEILNVLKSGDVFSTRRCFETLGVTIEPKGKNGEHLLIHGMGDSGFRAPKDPLDCGNSGTTMRLIMGILASQRFSTTLAGDPSLTRRPMNRVAEPLQRMGARISLKDSKFAPLKIEGETLRGIEYPLPVASAQVKSALLLAGLRACGKTVLRGLMRSRDHTERLLAHFGVQLGVFPDFIEVQGGQKLIGSKVQVPGDISSAAFWLTAAAIVPEGRVEIEGLSLNPTRTGFLDVLKRMGANIIVEKTITGPEPIGRLWMRGGELKGTEVTREEIPSLVDEIPLVAILGAFAKGRTVVKGAEELRVKESDRIRSVARNLQAMGAEIETRKDGFSIEGPQKLRGANIDSFDDHRIAMAFSIAALAAEGETKISDPECAAISYPGFFETLANIVG